MKYLLFLFALLAANASAMSGQALVTDLNARYNSTVAQCSNGTPAYYCSGVVLRAVDHSTFFKFWDYGSAATKLGSVAFTYIRGDVGSTSLNGNRKSGFILKDQTSALAAGKALKFRCFYPFPTESLDIRADHGCGFAPKVRSRRPARADLANCAKLAVPATTAAAWLKNFREHQSLPKNQCSLSTVVASQFKAALEAHSLVDTQWTIKPTELLIETWDESKPELLPLEAVFYKASAPTKLADAQKFQREYYLATSLYVPIVKLNLAAADKKVFSFSADDQVYGQVVVEQLNKRFADVRNDCAGKAAYFCNGIMIRTTKATTKYHAWDPSPVSIERNGISFSHLRKDLKMKALFIGEKQGFIFKSMDFAIKSNAEPILVRCAFPADGGTQVYRHQSCGPHDYYPDNSDLCEKQGILTLAAWKLHFNFQAGASGPRFYHQCGLGVSKDQFAIFLQGRNNFAYLADLNYTNEIVMAAWDDGIPERLPIEAFVYVYSANPAAALAGAQYMQNDYFEQAHNYLPVVRLKFDGENASFSFHGEEQVVNKVKRSRKHK